MLLCSSLGPQSSHVLRRNLRRSTMRPKLLGHISKKNEIHARPRLSPTPSQKLLNPSARVKPRAAATSSHHDAYGLCQR